jgi:GIY-YIG catalytic domain
MEAPLAGAYLIRLKRLTVAYPFDRSSIIYVGKSQDIDRRLLEHLRPSNQNETLYNYLTNHPCTFQFRKCNMNGARSLEQQFIDWCLHKLGGRPICNGQI